MPMDKSCPKKGNDRNIQRNREPCSKCGCLHGGEYLVCYNVCYGCGNSENMVRDCPHVNYPATANTEPQLNPITAAEPPKRNRFYALKVRKEKEK